MDATPPAGSTPTGFDVGRLADIGAWLDSEIANGLLPSADAVVWCGQSEVYRARAGMLDLARGEPLPANAIFRIYSMTKPVANVAAMMLWEAGRFRLDDAIAKYIPAFTEAKVLVGGNADVPQLAPLSRPMTVRDVLTHTAGLVYGNHDEGPVGDIYRRAGVDFSASCGTLAEVIDRLASMPLLSQPGQRWIYSCAHDLLGRLIEIWSGERLDIFFKDWIFAPLGMVDTGFRLQADATGRLVSNYRVGANGQLECMNHESTQRYAETATMFSAGGGLLSTMDDYLKFARLLLGRGSLNGITLLKPETLDLMTANQLPEGRDIPAMGGRIHGGMVMDGIGYGLGWAVTIDAARAAAAGVAASNGDFGWGGAASTYFWVDPERDMTAILMTQLMPSSTRPVRARFRELVHRAMVD